MRGLADQTGEGKAPGEEHVSWTWEPALTESLPHPNGGDGVREARVCGRSLKAPKYLYVSMVTA